MQFTTVIASATLPLLYVQAAAVADGSSVTAPEVKGSSTAVAPASSTGGFSKQESFCAPTNSTGEPDLSAPCNAQIALGRQCDDLSRKTTSNGASNGGSDLDPGANQACFCSTNGPGAAYWENVVGCTECLRLHGDQDDWVPKQAFTDFSSSYCAIAKPTSFMQDYLDVYVTSAVNTVDPGTATPTNVLGTSTAVSLYFTSTPIPGGSAVASDGSGATTVPPSSGAVASTTGAVTSTTGAATSTTASGAAVGTLDPAHGALALGVIGAAMLL